MRPIKFRGKRKDNGEPVYGNLITWGNQTFIWEKFETGYLTESQVKRLFSETFVEVIPETGVQFTGLHDKNGKEIYEGDIVAGSYGIPPVQVRAVVEYDDSAFVIKTPKHIPKEVTLRTAMECLDIKIIGNQAENPELLKKE